MIMQSNFNLDDKIYIKGALSIDYPKHPTQCHICFSTGEVKINGKTFCCPECGGKMETDYTKPKYRRQPPRKQPYTIGLIKIEVRQDKKEVKYMCKETGIGSGAIYQEEECFATYEEAILATDQENSQYEWQETREYGHTL